MVSTLPFWLLKWKILQCWTPLYMCLIEHNDICSSAFPQKRQNIFLFQERLFIMYVVLELRCKLINWNNRYYGVAFAVHCLAAIRNTTVWKGFKSTEEELFTVFHPIMYQRVLNEYYRSIQTALIITQKLIYGVWQLLGEICIQL